MPTATVPITTQQIISLLNKRLERHLKAILLDIEVTVIEDSPEDRANRLKEYQELQGLEKVAIALGDLCEDHEAVVTAITDFLIKEEAK